MSPVIKLLTERGVKFAFILTGQHYDYEMSMRFVEELGLPAPTSQLKLKNHKPASQIGEIMVGLERILEDSGCRILLIQGDTNSMLAAALAGVKLGLRIAHVEAGLRSYDWRMPEEHNRRMVDHVSDILFAPTETSRRNLLDEHVYGKILVTGNTVIDAANQHLPRASSVSETVKRVPFSEFCFATIHRKENVDSPEILESLCSVLLEMQFPVVFSVHPRSELRLREAGLYEKLAESPHVCLLPPVGYVDSLALITKSRFILTDSGGLQEEATVPSIRKPVILLRSSTERPEAVEAGFTKVAGTGKENVLSIIKSLLDNSPSLPDRSPFGDGKAAPRIVDAVMRDLGDLE